MDICETDIERIIHLLEKASECIERCCAKPCDLDKARRMKLMVKKLKKKKTNISERINIL